MNVITKDGAGDTRLKPKNQFETHLDYLRIRKDAITHTDFQMLVEFIMGDCTLEFDRPWSPGAGAIFFPHKVIGTHGVVGGFNVDEEGLYYTMIDIPGGYFEGKNATDQWRLIQGLYHRYQVKCTRIDIAFDDYSYSMIPLAEMIEACDKKQNFGFRNRNKAANWICGEKSKDTEYFGSRNSGKMVRVYDHLSECLRYEAEFKRQYAQPVFSLLASLERDVDNPSSITDKSGNPWNFPSSDNWDINVQRTMASVAFGAIDFRDRGTRKDSSRAGFRDSKRVSFYQEFIDKINVIPFRVRLSKPAKTILKTLEWVKRQCAPTLAMFAESFGRHEFNLWMREVVSHGSERLNNQKMLWVKEIERNKKLYLST
jgi:hypothetical protein